MVRDHEGVTGQMGGEKLRELILYICHRCEGDDTFGAVKLNKILFYADFGAYVLHEHSITGEEYQALDHGPAPRRLVPVRESLIAEKRLIVREKDYHGNRQFKPIALDSPDLTLFTAEEIAYVDDLIARFWGTNAAEISEKSHGFLGWRLAERGETIPYKLALIGYREPTLSDFEIAKRLEPIARSYLQSE